MRQLRPSIGRSSIISLGGRFRPNVDRGYHTHVIHAGRKFMLDKYRARWIGQMFAAAGVILSLSLVAYEMKLARDLAMADLYQQRTTLNVEIALAFFDRDEFHRALALQASGEELSMKQEMITVLAYDIAFLTMDSLYYQWELGLVPDDEWHAARATIISRLRDDTRARNAWIEGDGYREGFVEQVRILVPELSNQVAQPSSQ